MATPKYGAIITDLKGKMGGTIFQGGNSGKVMRNNGHKQGALSLNKQNAINKLTSAAVYWRQLSDSDRDLWNESSGGWPFYDRYGELYVGTGFQVMMAYNTALASFGLGPVTVPDTPSSTSDMVLDLVSIDDSGFYLVHFTNVGSSSDFIEVFASPPYSPGRNTNNPRLTKLIAQTANGEDTFLFKTEYQTKYGVPPIGSRVIVKTVQRNGGYPYPYYQYTLSTIVIA